ncbi:MAG: hypothetical protein AAFY48_13355 [Bacteroidota bacterium]
MPRKARIKLSDELKDAISDLSEKEKDKLLFRLIPKDPALVDRLTYELLEDADSPEERRADLRQEIEAVLKKSAAYFYSPGYLLLDLRAISGGINRHVKTTKDRYGEIELNLFMLNYSLDLLAGQLKRFSHQKSRTLDTYIIKRAEKLQKLIYKLHEDYQLDFSDDWDKLTEYIDTVPNLKRMARILEFWY